MLYFVTYTGNSNECCVKDQVYSILTSNNIPLLNKDVAFFKLTSVCHYKYYIMSAMASQITSLTIHRWPMNYPHKGPVTRKQFPFDNVIMCKCKWENLHGSIIQATKTMEISKCRTACGHLTCGLLINEERYSAEGFSLHSMHISAYAGQLEWQVIMQEAWTGITIFCPGLNRWRRINWRNQMHGVPWC